MKLFVVAAKAAGNPGPSGRVEIDDFDSPEKKQKGHLFTLISTNSAEENQALARLRQEYFSDLIVDPFNALTTAVSKIASEFSAGEEKINIAAAAFVDNVLYAAINGDIQAGVLRSSGLAKILIGRQGETVSASGYPKDGDRFVMASNDFFNTFTEAEMKLDQDNLISKITAQDNASKMGVVILRFSRLPTDFSRKVFPGKIIVKSETGLYEETKANKKLFSVGLILLILLLVSIFFGVRQNMLKERRAKYEDKIVKAENNLDESLKLFSLDQEKARGLFLESKTILEELKKDDIKDHRLEVLEKRLEEREGEILAEFQSEAQLYLDLALVVDNFSANSVAVSESNAVFLDAKNKKAVEVDIENKRTEALAGVEKIDNPKEIAVYSDRKFILTDSNVVELNGQAKEVLAKDWQGVWFKIYGGNIYMLDRENSLVYRFPGSRQDFGSKQLWLAPGINLDLTKVKDWTIDGSIWLAFESGKLLKLTQGSPSNIQLDGLNPALDNLAAIYSSEDLSGVYLLDKAIRRIVVVDKEGHFLAQYRSENLANAENLIVSEKKKLGLFLVNGNKLYSIELKHLK